eukprot:gene25647-11309_t
MQVKHPGTFVRAPVCTSTPTKSGPAGPASGRSISVRRVEVNSAQDPSSGAETEIAGSQEKEWRVRYLYDGECPLRKPEVDALIRLDNGKGAIDFVDISKPDYNPEMNGGVTYEMAMGPPHALLSDGSIIKSVEVYRALYQAVGLGFVWQATKLPVVGPVVDGVFDLWSDNRLRLTGRPPLAGILAQQAREEGKEYEKFFKSPFGKFISWLSESLAKSPANDYKVKLAALTAGKYDVEAVSAKLGEDIADNKVLMFSFSTWCVWGVCMCIGVFV